MLQEIRQNLSRLLGSAPPKVVEPIFAPVGEAFPLHGFKPGTPIPGIEVLSDAELEKLNALVNWQCFVVDAQGRRFGNRAALNKNHLPREVPDYRHRLWASKAVLKDKHILEIGCFEGVHTSSLCQLAGKVTAVDVRIEYVAKTMLRAAFYGVHPTVLQCDIEKLTGIEDKLKADICHHVGVFYHLHDPVGHLQKLATLIGEGILLDTHYASISDCNAEYESGGRKYPCRSFSGNANSGTGPDAKWIPLESIQELLRELGFHRQEIFEDRAERNGPRVLIWATRT